MASDNDNIVTTVDSQLKLAPNSLGAAHMSGQFTTWDMTPLRQIRNICKRTNNHPGQLLARLSKVTESIFILNIHIIMCIAIA